MPSNSVIDAPAPCAQVGDLYGSSRSGWTESAQLRLDADGRGGELLVVLAAPERAEITAIESGRADFAWVNSPHLALVAFRFDQGIDWSDFPYTPHRAEHPGGIAIDDEPSELLLRVVLVDADTGLVRAVRELCWPPHFAQVARTCAARLWDAPFSERAADQDQDLLYTRYRTTADMVRRRADASCVGMSTRF
ncbi:hypothetical protein ACFVUS_27375 [Nocardia sp. NPDC058058]|uniref:hypothetical protein n=1 Tax=Nocardia sp. NPDC058058 TaxID=3346317 RepID=UPI0036D8F4DF